MIKNLKLLFLLAVVSLVGFGSSTNCYAQESIPRDETMFTYHTFPKYRESESHPLRVAAYILHPVGWVLKEAVFKPLSYFASSTPTRSIVMGYKDPYYFRRPDCFSKDDTSPSCTSILPFNHSSLTNNSNSENGTEDLAQTGEVDSTIDLTFPMINFGFDSASLTPEGKRYVDEIGTVLKDPDSEKYSLNILIEGHTDDVGSADYNQKLGEMRALTVKNALVNLGIEESRLKTVSYGENMPFVEGTSNEARASNRRAVVRKQ